ncbi:MAG TPA: SPOR domain-containing protein [Caulobacteraceae bacterium]|jgi:hypothetical protein|nr:SPOR domain-containing protein [Caulobacteraceae bacterium]
MSDLEDRGAYTPFSRDQLAFDPRGLQRRRPVPLTLMLSAVVLVAMAGAALLFYQSGVRGRNEPPRAVGTHVGSIKTPPPAPAGPPAEKGIDVYVQDRPESAAGQPVYTDAPEQPQPRVAETQAAPPPVARTAPKAAPDYPTVDAAVAAAETAPPPPLKPARAVTPKPVAVAAVALARARPDLRAAIPAVKTADATAKSVPGGGQVVQIGAYSSKALAEQEFSKVRAGFAKYTSGRATHVEGVQKGSATLYRAAFTGFSKAQAAAFCGALKAAGRACIVK